MSSPFAPPAAPHTPPHEAVPASPLRTATWQLLAALGLAACLWPAAMQWHSLASAAPAPTEPQFGRLVAAACPLLLVAFASGGAAVCSGLTVLDRRASLRTARWVWLGITLGLGILPIWTGAAVLLLRRYSLMAAP
ncbi:MAG: hypothetical protein KTR31_01105 [Myxococcales bacterium]|nr:hypothetical protein [Myxococcales bacterium]